MSSSLFVTDPSSQEWKGSWKGGKEMKGRMRTYDFYDKHRISIQINVGKMGADAAWTKSFSSSRHLENIFASVSHLKFIERK